MQFNKEITAACFAGILAAMALSGCSGNKSSQTAEEAEEEAPIVKLETVYETDVVQKGVYTASVDPDLINNISSSMPNRIKEIYVDEGMNVSKGQKLVVLDDVNIVGYETQVANAKANLDNVQTNYNRAVELFKIGGGTKQNVDAMETQLITAKNNLASAERTLRNARENTVLTAPISGVVTARNYDPGDMTGALPILTIAKVQPVKVVASISESEFSKVHKGMKADCTFDTYGDQVFEGTVSMVSPTIDTSSRTFGIEVLLPNPDSKVLPGMFGRITLNLGEARHVVVPDKAVVKQPGSGNQYVYVYKDGKVTYNKVELGQRIDNAYEIISGVEDGAQVVVSGQSKLADGMEVRVAK
ncbi:MAG: efflux RND transporter periplasmic adaptor subunit [Muribaculaceae bacterium]|nr:efflux RND transporter periplasmic adaptor subunit [Muribaculaceae bacterium]